MSAVKSRTPSGRHWLDYLWPHGHNSMTEIGNHSPVPHIKGKVEQQDYITVIRI